MMSSFIVGTIGAFAISIVLLYGVSDVVAVLTTPTGTPVLEIVSRSSESEYHSNSCLFQYRQATGSDAAAAAFGISMTVMGICSITLALISASRLT